MAKDFTQAHQADFFDDIYESTSDLDVSVLINNVGLVNMKSHKTAEKSDLRDVITVNTYPQNMLTHEFLNRMTSRSTKSAIIDMSSFSGGKPVSVCPTYSATKGYNDFLSRAIRHEFGDQIDMISVRPLWVSTPMTDFEKVGNFTITPDD